MSNMTLAYGVASPCIPAMGMTERFGVSPILAAQGTGVSFAGQLAAQPAAAHAAHTTKNVVDRKADDWVLPRGRRL